MAYLTEDQHEIVSKAVRDAEQTTSGEIVTVLADRSDGYSDVVLVWAAVIAFTSMALLALIPEQVMAFIDGLFSSGWGSTWGPSEIIELFVGFGLFVWLAIWALFSWDPIRFALIPGPVKTARVHERAIRHFKVGAERRTHGRTGILIYLSMREHRAEIVADEPIAGIVDAEVWGEAMADMLVEIKHGRVAEGMAAGVRDVGKVLSKHFPPAEDDENELPDRLIEV